MGLFKIFTRRSSKARLEGNDTQLRLEPFSQQNGDIRQPEPDVPAISTTSQQEPDVSPRTADLDDHTEAWDSTSAPAPFVPRHPSLVVVVEDRPRTAASTHSVSRDWSQSPARPRREPRKPPVSFRKPSSLSSMSNAYQNTAHTGGSENDINSLASRLRRTNGSRSSLGSLKSKDILDAQEEIHPTDFRSRVQAAGARDYGEDVADRNITRHRYENLSPTPDPRQMSNRTKSLSSPNVTPRITAPRDSSQPTLGLPLKEEPTSGPLELAEGHVDPNNNYASHRHSRSNESDDQIRYHRHTANTSLGSKSAESFMTATNGQHGSDWSPATNRSKNFNIDDYVSSDDDSFTTPEKKARPTAEGEEDLLFKVGYGISGAALPGLEALGEEDEYSGVPTRNNRNDTVSSKGSAAMSSSPKDTRLRFGTDHDLSPTLRHVRSDPEELYMSTVGRLLVRGFQRPSTANVWEPKEEHEIPAEHLDESYTPSTSSTDSNEPGDRRSTVGSLAGFRPRQRSESSFSVYSTGGTVTTTITGGARAIDHRDTYNDMGAPRRGLKRLSALGTLYGRSMSGSFGSSDPWRPTTASNEAPREEMRASDIIRRRKEDKTRKRSDGVGLRSIREKRLTEAFGRPGNDEIARLREHLRDDDEMWDSGR
ncbi:hypothetical protein DHEL01_v203214 [Diaporthe helianthi]|uniref:Uncharacterized protein n=1 Tax=Diaporthe helianthi TaxID=158607 RepID=A0A2P5I7C8_DIAHE|nr:hypothetical protein DHEL01_v203214 [Diaporthe helianthi]